MVTVVLAASRPPQPWANGLGTTSEVVCWPPGSNLATCQWRVSVADMVAHSTFSGLPGIDRTLVALAGDGIGLEVDGRAITLAPFEVARFSGNSAVSGGPLGAATQDLNLMVRQGVADADLTVLRTSGEHTLHPAASELVLAFIVDGGATIAADGTALAAGDAILVEECYRVTLRCSGAVIVISVRLISVRLGSGSAVPYLRH